MERKLLITLTHISFKVTTSVLNGIIAIETVGFEFNLHLFIKMCEIICQTRTKCKNGNKSWVWNMMLITYYTYIAILCEYCKKKSDMIKGTFYFIRNSAISLQNMLIFPIKICMKALWIIFSESWVCRRLAWGFYINIFNGTTVSNQPLVMIDSENCVCNATY